MSEKEHGGLKRPGRPVKGSVFSGKCDVRLTLEENNMLDTLAKQNGVSRSDVVRRALRDYARYCLEREE